MICSFHILLCNEHSRPSLNFQCNYFNDGNDLIEKMYCNYLIYFILLGKVVVNNTTLLKGWFNKQDYANLSFTQDCFAFLANEILIKLKVILKKFTFSAIVICLSRSQEHFDLPSPSYAGYFPIIWPFYLENHFYGEPNPELPSVKDSDS